MLLCILAYQIYGFCHQGRPPPPPPKAPSTWFQASPLSTTCSQVTGAFPSAAEVDSCQATIEGLQAGSSELRVLHERPWVLNDHLMQLSGPMLQSGKNCALYQTMLATGGEKKVL